MSQIQLANATLFMQLIYKIVEPCTYVKFGIWRNKKYKTKLYHNLALLICFLNRFFMKYHATDVASRGPYRAGMVEDILFNIVL